MATGAVEANEVSKEGYGAELIGETYRIMRHLAQGPQDERYFLTRSFGIGFDRKTDATLRGEMNLSEDEFNALRKRALKRLRAAQRGDGGH